jgi:hypothetical protein
MKTFREKLKILKRLLRSRGSSLIFLLIMGTYP